MTLKDHPINFLKPRTTSSGHSYNLRANDNNRNIVYADSCCCRTQCSGSFISFASKCVNNFYCLHSRYSVNYLLIVNLNPFNSVNSAMWQINGIYIYIYIYIYKQTTNCRIQHRQGTLKGSLKIFWSLS